MRPKAEIQQNRNFQEISSYYYPFLFLEALHILRRKSVLKEIVTLHIQPNKAYFNYAHNLLHISLASQTAES